MRKINVLLLSLLLVLPVGLLQADTKQNQPTGVKKHAIQTRDYIATGGFSRACHRYRVCSNVFVGGVSIRKIGDNYQIIGRTNNGYLNAVSMLQGGDEKARQVYNKLSMRSIKRGENIYEDGGFEMQYHFADDSESGYSELTIIDHTAKTVEIITFLP